MGAPLILFIYVTHFFTPTPACAKALAGRLTPSLEGKRQGGGCQADVKATEDKT